MLAGALLAGCGGGGSAGVPSVTQAPLGSIGKLQLAVGTATIAQDGTTGLNVVATFRSSNGGSAVLADTPMLSGPAGFTVPASATGAYSPTGNVDAGTANISGSPQVPRNQTAVNSSLGTYTGVFSYGFGPFNSDQTGSAYYPGNPNATAGNGFGHSVYDGASIPASTAGLADPTQPLPYYSADPFDYLGGPPAYPFFNDGTFPAGLAGYSQGFAAFETGTPLTGTYNLKVQVTAANAQSQSFTASATLASASPLAAYAAAPTLSKDGAGGGTVSVSVPSDSRITETMVYIVDVTAAGGMNFYTVGPLKGTGVLTGPLPDTLGPCFGSGCQNGSKATPSIATGDTYYLAAVSFDYPAFEAGPPGNTSQTPAITGTNGQADISMSPISAALTY